MRLFSYSERNEPVGEDEVIDTRPRWDWRWTLACAFGELLGWLAAVGASSGLQALLGSSASNAGALWLVSALVYGFVLGLVQWLAMRRYLNSTTWLPWSLATTAGGAMRWLILVFAVLGLGNVLQAGALPAVTFVLGLGTLSGVLVGVCQALVLRLHISRSGWWALSNAVAWVVVMPLWPLLFFVGTYIIAGPVVGAVTGAITSLTLVRLFPPRNLYG
jgi:hypothetical protein